MAVKKSHLLFLLIAVFMGIMGFFFWNLTMLSQDINSVARILAEKEDWQGSVAKASRIESEPTNYPPAIRTPPRKPKLAYGLLTYQKANMGIDEAFQKFARLFNAIYDIDHVYVIHLDLKSSKGLRQRINEELIRGLKNVQMIAAETVSWAGITVVERTLALMDKALEMDNEWSHFIALGQEDYPLERNEYIAQELAKLPVKNLMYCWNIESHNFFGQIEHMSFRVSSIFFDDFVSKTHFTGWSRPMLKGVKFYKTLQQMILSREFTEYATRSTQARRLVIYFANTLAPDEIYFPTLIMNSPFAHDVSCNYSGHYSYWDRPGNSWHPEYLHMEYLPNILNSGSYYARKFDSRSDELKDELDRIRAVYPSLSAYKQEILETRPNSQLAKNIRDRNYKPPEIIKRKENPEEKPRDLSVEGAKMRNNK